MTKKVAVALSGGVDSSLAACLLKEKGYEVGAVTMLLHSEGKAGENALHAIEDAAAICRQLDIPHEVLDLRDSFRREVLDYFVGEYMCGRTPNPCVRCNPRIKFGKLLEYVRDKGWDYMATGHYVRLRFDQERRRYRLFCAENAKDQSYALCGLSQEQLSHCIFPIGDLRDKNEVRALAERAGIAAADKADSQDICFVDGEDYSAVLERLSGIASKKGYFIAPDGRRLNQHKGIAHYTIGQRRGLDVALGQRVFVRSIDADSGDVYLAYNEDLFQRALSISNLNWIAFDSVTDEIEIEARIRYHAKAARARFIPANKQSNARIVFDQPQRAITPGQAIAFYEGEELLGGATIESVVEADDAGAESASTTLDD